MILTAEFQLFVAIPTYWCTISLQPVYRYGQRFIRNLSSIRYYLFPQFRIHFGNIGQVAAGAVHIRLVNFILLDLFPDDIIVIQGVLECGAVCVQFVGNYFQILPDANQEILFQPLLM